MSVNKEKYKKRLIALKVLLIIGMLVSLYLTYEHFSPTASKFCNFGNGFDCNIVNKSPYSNLDGISYLLTIDFGLPLPFIDIASQNFFLNLITSNAFLGFLTFLLLFLLLLIKKQKKIILIKSILIFSFIYGFYLFLIQHFVLKTYCVFCLLLDFIIIISLIITLTIKNEK